MMGDGTDALDQGMHAMDARNKSATQSNQDLAKRRRDRRSAIRRPGRAPDRVAAGASAETCYQNGMEVGATTRPMSRAVRKG